MSTASGPRPHADPGSTVLIRPRNRAPRVRRADAERRRLAPTIARWPLEVDERFETAWLADPACAVVRRSLGAYRSGRADAASETWDSDITWTVAGAPPVGGTRAGSEQVFAYHALLERLSEGTFRQDLVAMEGSRGLQVNAYLRTTAVRAGTRLDIPTLTVFELGGGRIRRVTELPGDGEAWDAFWRD